MSSKGFLIYAFDNNDIEYGRIADICALLVNNFTNYPCAVVKDSSTIVNDKLYSNIIVVDSTTTKNSWRNQDRSNYFDLSPFDETIVIDSDYLLFNNHLCNLFGLNESLILSKEAYQVDNSPVRKDEQRLSNKSIDMIWATCFYFKKDDYSKKFFHLVNLIKKNYLFHYELYGIKNTTFRNDYVFSIAYHMLREKISEGAFYNPYGLVTAYNTTEIEALNKDGVVLSNLLEEDGLHTPSHENLFYLKNTSIHLLNKKTILDFYDEFFNIFY